MIDNYILYLQKSVIYPITTQKKMLNADLVTLIVIEKTKTKIKAM